MNWAFSLYVAILFFLLTPGILLSLPPKGGKFLVAAVHAIVFAVLLHFTGSFVAGVSTKLTPIAPVVQEGARGKR